MHYQHFNQHYNDNDGSNNKLSHRVTPVSKVEQGDILLDKIDQLMTKLYYNRFNQYQKDYINASLVSLTSIIKHIDGENQWSMDIFNNFQKVIESFDDLIDDYSGNSIHHTNNTVLDHNRHNYDDQDPSSSSKKTWLTPIKHRSSLQVSVTKENINGIRLNFKHLSPGMNQDQIFEGKLNHDGLNQLKNNFQMFNRHDSHDISREKSFDSVFLD